MLFNETPIELLHTDIIVFKKDIILDSLKCFVMKKMGQFLNSTQTLESFYVPGHNI